ncbi:hypothetical protein LTR97_007414 [Elasticomyces elasticus]|uniref:F-box domain-containing protein n=1 Tax=Elasticomyces elasticus TaxID=574655 RepID=A0AAN7ZZX2_9PEZI|nr:hypothetical protein LTR97_007414 [Elasticomyces elasticus]
MPKSALNCVVTEPGSSFRDIATYSHKCEGRPGEASSLTYLSTPSRIIFTFDFARDSNEQDVADLTNHSAIFHTMASPTSSALLSIPNELKLHVLSHLNFQDLDSVSTAYEEFQALIAAHRRPLMREIHKNSYDRLRSTIDRLGFADKDLCTAFLEFTNRVPAQKLRGYHKARGVGMFARWYCADNRHIFETDRLWPNPYYQVFDFGCEVLQIKAVEEESNTRETDGCMRLEIIMESMRSLGFPSRLLGTPSTHHRLARHLAHTPLYPQHYNCLCKKRHTAYEDRWLSERLDKHLLAWPPALPAMHQHLKYHVVEARANALCELAAQGTALELEEIAEIMGSIKVESYSCCRQWGLRRLK